MAEQRCVACWFLIRDTPAEFTINGHSVCEGHLELAGAHPHIGDLAQAIKDNKH